MLLQFFPKKVKINRRGASNKISRLEGFLNKNKPRRGDSYSGPKTI